MTVADAADDDEEDNNNDKDRHGAGAGGRGGGLCPKKTPRYCAFTNQLRNVRDLRSGDWEDIWLNIDG